MGKMLKIPDRVYEELKSAAKSSGVTPADWIAARLPKERKPGRSASTSAAPKKTMADFLRGYVGVVSSGGKLSAADSGRVFAEGMVEKRKKGKL